MDTEALKEKHASLTKLKAERDDILRKLSVFQARSETPRPPCTTVCAAHSFLEEKTDVTFHMTRIQFQAMCIDLDWQLLMLDRAMHHESVVEERRGVFSQYKWMIQSGTFILAGLAMVAAILFSPAKIGEVFRAFKSLLQHQSE